MARIFYQWPLLKSKELEDLPTITMRKKSFKVYAQITKPLLKHMQINFIKANEETARKVLPKWKKDRKTNASDDPRMVKAREELPIASDRNYRSPTENN